MPNEEKTDLTANIKVVGASEAKKEIESTAKSAEKASESTEKKQSASVKRAREFAQKAPGGAAAGISSGLQGLTGSKTASAFGQIATTAGGTVSGSGIPGALADTAKGALPAVIAGAGGGALALAISGAMSGPLNLFIDRFFNERQQVESEAGRAVQSQVSSFAEKGIAVGDGDIQQLLEVERARSRRVLDAQKQVAKIQDLTNNSIEGMISRTFRRSVDALIG